jgi:hypothetical protein
VTTVKGQATILKRIEPNGEPPIGHRSSATQLSNLPDVLMSTNCPQGTSQW